LLLGGASIGAGAAAVGADVLNLGCQLVSDFSESARPRIEGQSLDFV